LKLNVTSKNPLTYFALIAGTVLVLLGGCTSTAMDNYLPPLDSEVIVTVELSNSSGNRIVIQNGEVQNQNRRVDRRVPNCQFRIQRPRGATGSFSIQPDTFVVTRVFRERVRDVLENATMITYMNLSSEAQPEVHQMLCRRLGKASWRSFVTIDEMIKTLSPIVEINLALEQPVSHQ
jgi:hypothetical protein